MNIDSRYTPLEPVQNFNVKLTTPIKEGFIFSELDDYRNDNSIYTTYFFNEFFANIQINSALENNKIQIVNTVDPIYKIDDIIYPCFCTSNFVNKSFENIQEYDYNYYFNFKNVVDWSKFEDLAFKFTAFIYNTDTKNVTEYQNFNSISALDKNKNFVIGLLYSLKSLSIINVYENSNYFNAFKTNNGFSVTNFNFPSIRYNPNDYRVYNIENANTSCNFNFKIDRLQVPTEMLVVDTHIEIDGVNFIVRDKGNNTHSLDFCFDIVDFEKILSCLNVAILDEHNKISHCPETNENGLITGILLPYEEWKISDSTNNNSFEDTKEPTIIVPDKDDVENMELSYILTQNTAPFTRHYIVSMQNLNSLSLAITTNSPTIPDGLNVFDNMVSLSVFPLDLTSRFTSSSDTIHINSWDSGVNALKTEKQICISKTYYHYVTRKYNDFRDFEPFSTYELLLPLFGMYKLPNFIVGHTLKIQLIFDLISHELIYHISISDDTQENYTLIDKIKCVCGTSISFTAENNSLKLLEQRTNDLSLINSVVALSSSIATENIAGIVSTTTSIASNVQNSIALNNKTRTETISQNTSVASFSDVKKIYFYSTHNVTDISNLKNDGYLYNKITKLNNLSGKCKCSGVVVDGIACTSQEQNLIKNALENYFII